VLLIVEVEVTRGVTVVFRVVTIGGFLFDVLVVISVFLVVIARGVVVFGFGFIVADGALGLRVVATVVLVEIFLVVGRAVVVVVVAALRVVA
jgi:hypothetical protein